jgi:hypothetical protein
VVGPARYCSPVTGCHFFPDCVGRRDEQHLPGPMTWVHRASIPVEAIEVEAAAPPMEWKVPRLNVVVAVDMMGGEDGSGAGAYTRPLLSST